MTEHKYEETEGYDSIAAAIKAHAGIIIFLTLIILLKIGVLPKHTVLVLIGALAGVWGIFELMASKYTILAAIGWIIGVLWILFGDRGILSGY